MANVCKKLKERKLLQIILNWIGKYLQYCINTDLLFNLKRKRPRLRWAFQQLTHFKRDATAAPLHLHQSLFQQFVRQTFLVDAQPRKVSENIPCSEILKRINVEDQSFMHCCPRHGLWNELWCLGKHAGGCFYNNSNSGKNSINHPLSTQQEAVV